jgi:chorismate mutase
MLEKRLCALRGAACCLNSRDDIQKQTVALYDKLLLKNDLEEQDVVSVFFSVTRDLDTENPASALRREGRAGACALFVNQEAHFHNSLERVIRVLIHCYMDISRKPVHVYQNGAEQLRPDRNVT